ncbi:MAG: ABC transporter substrate-binding protein [Endozoicomonas sp. (ex Botrylloides leachii)]|nr:ABC transporter substrate-binding protein [Endozoicomonas sp. (ex Botrylloides leachii)]
MSKIKTFLSIALFLFTLPCFGNTQPVIHQTPETLRIGMLKLMSGGVVQLAKKEGFFQEQGINIKILSFDSAQQVARAVASGDVDIGLTGLTAAVYNLAAKGKLKIIAGSSREVRGWKGSAYVVSNKEWNAGIRKPEQLQDVSMGVTDIGSTFHYIAGLLADKYHFSLEKKIKLVPLGSVKAMRTAIAKSQVDSVIIPGMVARELQNKNEGHILGYVGDETPWQVTAVFASSKLLDHKRKGVEKFLTGFRKGCSLYHLLFNTSSPAIYSTERLLAQAPMRNQAATIIGHYVRPKLTPVAVSSFPIYIDAQGGIDLNSLKHQIHWYQSHNMVDQHITVNQVVDQPLLVPLSQ